jgi:heme-degrading monooxygenase HmoA
VFARSSTFKGDPSGIRAGVSYVQDEVMSMLEEVDGFVGLSMMVDRGSGECITTTSWETADAMRASSDRITGVRGRLGGLLTAPATVQEWDIAVMHRAEDTPAERWCRVSWLRTSADNVDHAIEIYRTKLLSRIEELPGYCSASLMVDRARDRVCATTSYSSLETLQQSRDDGWMIREDGIRETGVDIMDAAEYELAIAHLRVPATV